MKTIFIVTIVLISSMQIVFGQAEMRRPVFTGGGSTSKGVALTMGQSFAGNKKAGCKIIQIGAQTGVDCDSLTFNGNCDVLGYWVNGTYILTGIKEKNLSILTNDFNVYPNPTNDLLYLSSARMNSDFIVQLYSMNGELVITDYWVKGETKLLNIENLSPAIYLIRFVSKDWKTINKKLINKL
ncbi:MAG: T9SS type A sorting domain-containing protein [Bacteroidetes bacterium]|nr:T9SS type A sorting domain-containing protein [Bacteroidota bacterium]